MLLFKVCGLTFKTARSLHSERTYLNVFENKMATTKFESSEVSKKKEYIINIITSIHNKKQRADINSISVKAKDINMDDIKHILDQLCEENILKITLRKGMQSYRFTSETVELLGSSSDVINDTDEDINIIKPGYISENSENISERDIKESEDYLQRDIKKSKDFYFTQNFIKSHVDLKSFITKEVNRLQTTHSDCLINQLREENRFLKSELKETRLLVSTILETITNMQVYSGVNNQYKQKKQNLQENDVSETNSDINWHTVPKGKSFKKSVAQTPTKDFNSVNCFNYLPQENGDTQKHVKSKNNRSSKVYDLEDKLLDSEDICINNFETPIVQSKQTTNNKRPNPVINQHPNRERVYQKQDNNGSFDKITPHKSIRILSDSIPKGIRVREFNKCISNGYAKFKSFPGASIAHLNYYSNPTLTEEKPNIVVIHVGINNLLSAESNAVSDEVIADEIINLGVKCVQYKAEKVFVSGILKCSRVNPDRINKINELLLTKCQQKNFIYIDNNNITEQHLWKDGLHLKEDGKIILAKNYLHYINNFLYEIRHTSGWI